MALTMLKCAPYIKSLCSSIHNGLWREGTSSLPGSPVRQVLVPSPTRSEGGAIKPRALSPGGDRNNDYDDEDDEVVAVSEKGEVILKRPSLVVSTTDKEGEYATSTVINSQPSATVKSDLINALKKIRPESPDLTRAAKRLELAKKQNKLGAISKKRTSNISSPTR